MNKILFFAVCFLGMTTTIVAQEIQRGQVRIDGQLLSYMIDEQGDTLLLANLNDINVSSPRSFSSREEYLRYQMYRRYALKVYPYAKDAIRIFKQVERESQGMKKGKRKKYMKEKHQELKDQFEEPLKNLTKTQGLILVKMIERELDTPMYDLIKDLRGNFTAFYWNTMSKFYGQHLKEGYVEDQDPILDAVLHDLDVSFD